MELATLTSLIEKLKSHDEISWIEAKDSLADATKIWQTFSALANSASFANEEYGYMIWWLENATWELTDTNFTLKSLKPKWQSWEIWLNEKLNHQCHFEEFVFSIKNKKVVVVRIKNCGSIPIPFEKQAYIRKWSHNQLLIDYPVIQRAILMKNLHDDWSAEVCEGVDILWLDSESIRLARAGFEIKSKSSKRHLSDEQFLMDLGLIYSPSEITNTAVILLGKENIILRHLHRHQVFFEYRGTHEKTWYDERKTWQKSVFLMLDDVWNSIDRHNTLTQYSEGLLGRQNIYSINQNVTKELIINALIHQDFRMPWQVDIRLSPEYLTVINPGWFMPWVDIHNLIWARSTPRNQRLADVADKLNLMERSGQWMDLIFMDTIKEWKWKPSYQKSDSFTVYAEVPLTVLDVNFVKYISHISNDQQKLLWPYEYLFLESLRTGEKVEYDSIDIEKLVKMWLIESVGKTRGKRWILSQRYYYDHNQWGIHTKIVWLERDKYKELILGHIKKKWTWTKQEFMDAFDEKNSAWVTNILMELKKEGKIFFRWSKLKWHWELMK
jgi:ATP-dependent DNA helicase RecG